MQIVYACRGVNNVVMELRTICNHPFLSHLHVPGSESMLGAHALPPEVRVCGKLDMLDRLLIKLLERGHKVQHTSLKVHCTWLLALC